MAALQDACEGQIKMMRHCRQRRADAVGLLGDDRSSEFTIEKVMAMDVQYDLETRKAYQAKIEDEPAARITTRQEELAELAGEMSEVKLLAAVATKVSGLINEHFGHAREFQVYELSTSGVKLVGHRRVDFTARADIARRIGLRASSAPSTTAMLHSWPRLVAACVSAWNAFDEVQAPARVGFTREST
ncbi:hypothetical protein ACVW1A_000259 [Bradyrhizobium sp. LB1.3]